MTTKNTIFYVYIIYLTVHGFVVMITEIPRADVSNNLPSQIDEGSDFEVCVMLDAEPITEVRVNIRTIEPSSSARGMFNCCSCYT